MRTLMVIKMFMLKWNKPTFMHHHALFYKWENWHQKIQVSLCSLSLFILKNYAIIQDNNFDKMTEEKSKILLKDFVVFLSTWGTGKTELMVKKAKKLSKKGEKVLLVIITFGRNSSLPTLLVHQLQNTLYSFLLITPKIKNFHWS